MKKIEDLKKKALYGVLAIIPAVASGVASNYQAKAESKAAARAKSTEVEKKSEENSNAAVKSYEPIIAEIHDILDAAHDWAEDTDEDLEGLIKEMASLREDVQYCKAYVDFDSRGRYVPSRMPSSLMGDPADEKEDEAPPAPKPMAKVPTTVQKAKQYIKARKEQKCAPGDPLCGAAAL